MATTHPDTAIWLAIVAAGVGTYLLRLSFIALLGRVDTVPPNLVGVLRFVPAAVLAAIVVPSVVALEADPTGLALAYDPAKVVAAVVAAGVAWKTENVTATIAVGMATLWAVSWGLG